MTSVIKGVLALVVLAAAGAAQAQSAGALPYVGRGTLAFSADGNMALKGAASRLLAPDEIPDVAGVSVGGGVNPASYQDISADSSVLGLNFSSVVVTGNAVTSLAAPDAFLFWQQRTVDFETGDVTTRSVALTGLVLDLTTSTVSANLFAFDAAGAATSLGKHAVFIATQAGIVGGTEGNILVSSVDENGSPLYGASGSLAGSLALGATAGDLILNNLGLGGAGNQVVRNFWLGANWGSVSFGYAPAVPELSRYAMLGLGLIGMFWVARRRQSTA